MDAMFLNTLLARVLLLSWMWMAVPGQGQGQRPAPVDPLTASRADPQCWDSSSALLLEMRSPRIADAVPAFWDMMVFLKSSANRRHTMLFWDLARVFWDIYMDCVMSRTHGLGRRQLKRPNGRVTAVHSLVTDKSFSVNSQSNFSRLKQFSEAWLSVRVRRAGPGTESHTKMLSRATKSATHKQ
ncbi:protein FAM237A-like [Lampris incognitus]|uniref:protein FAM237A-like n=1 Tax=Lampris incognitus TaxID=2546036 RepID=UPI0024B5090C|nr:protein FAM237A-like [Lampris incognitus]